MRQNSLWSYNDSDTGMSHVDAVNAYHQNSPEKAVILLRAVGQDVWGQCGASDAALYFIANSPPETFDSLHFFTFFYSAEPPYFTKDMTFDWDEDVSRYYFFTDISPVPAHPLKSMTRGVRTPSHIHQRMRSGME
jgi:hypothetical protein